MSLVIKPPPPTVPFGRTIDGRAITIDQAWDLFLRALVERVGGTEAPSNTELALAQYDDAGLEEMKAELYRLRDDVRPPLATEPLREPLETLVYALVAELAEVRKELESLKVAP
jgi:hypothetical protein